ncbi:hypothetical protein KDX27_39095 [Burkholderia cenocepacia]|uniref:hypothetical protein n=1 Tax=Burkholderia cenocepacia TaxID=95486 RepID=UPI001BA06395|nr:hypothetical protein [Burkholderia cenocepacia]MBR8029907.1 hypothetical protein [Burkholderia cenocepacia]MBR8173699.1 hypothetical protein [Burkholderia cenocepacia]
MQSPQEQEREYAERAIREQREASDRAIAEQHQDAQQRSAEVAERNKARLMSWYENKHDSDVGEAVAAPRQELQGTEPQIAHGQEVLEAYKAVGAIQSRESVPVSANGVTGADHALSVERMFRERQRALDDRINDPNTDPQERVVLEHRKSADYHTHKADQLKNIIDMTDLSAKMAGGDTAANRKFLGELHEKLDYHTTQAALAAQNLYVADKQLGRMPSGVDARVSAHSHHQPLNQLLPGHLDMQSSAHQHKPASTELTASASNTAIDNKAGNPALERLMARRAENAERNVGSQPSDWLREQVAEAKNREAAIEQAKTQQTAQEQAPDRTAAASR